MERTVPIDSIVVNRTLESGDDISKLTDHIRDAGLQVPLLVDQGYELIDGLRRLEALRSLGFTVVHVVPTTMFLPAVTWLKRAREHGVLARPLTSRRIWQLYKSCLPLISVSRSHEMKGKLRGQGVHINGRSTFLDAIGMTSESRFQASIQTYRLAEENSTRGDLARQAVELLERGQLSIYQAVDYVKRHYTEGAINSSEDQLALLQNTVHALSGINFSLKRMGNLNEALTAQQLAPIAKDLRNFRRTLHQLIHTLEGAKDS